MHPVGEVNGVEIVLHVVPVGREHAPDELHRGRVVVREHVGPDTPAAERLDLAEFRDGDRHQKLPVGPRDPFVRDVGRTREAAHLLARLVEGDVAVFEAADHLGGVVGVDELRHGVHAERAERRDAAIQVEVHEDAPEVEYYVFDLFHGFRSRSGRVRRHKDTKFCVPALRSFSADGILPAQDAFFRRGAHAEGDARKGAGVCRDAGGWEHLPHIRGGEESIGHCGASAAGRAEDRPEVWPS